MASFRVGLIGAGEIVRTIHLPVLRQMTGVSIAWILDRDARKAAELAKRYGAGAAHSRLEDCPDVDAVLMAIPVGARREAWELAAARRWHVLCEKPLARSLAEFDAIAASMRRAGKVWAAGLMRRFYAGTSQLASLAASGVFGELIEVWAGEGGPMRRTGRPADWYQHDRELAGGGILIETGAHLLDQVVVASQAEDARVDAYAQEPGGLSMEFSANVRGRLVAREGREVPFTCVLSRADDVCNGIFLRYPGVVLRLDHGPEGLVHLCDPRGRRLSSLSATGHGVLDSLQAFHAEWRAFLRSCEQPGGAEQDAEHRRRRLAVKIIDECYTLAAREAG